MAEKRTIISMPDALRERVRDYRFSKRINTEAEAMRTLIEKGLEAEAAPPQTRSTPQPKSESRDP